MRPVDINEFPKKVGHMGLEMTKKIATNHGITLTGTYKVCEFCARAKAKQGNLGQEIQR